MRRTFWSITAVALAVGVSACEPREGAEDTAVTTGGADTAGGMMQDDSITRMQEGMGERMEFAFEPVRNSGASGEVYLTPVSDSTTVVITLEPPSDAAEQPHHHMAHIHTGTCDAIGSVVAPLDTVVSGPDRGPTSTTVVGIDIATLTDGNHLVAAHEAGGTPGSPIVCAEIPSQAGGPTGGNTTGSDTTTTSM